jgi:hypothetical protein
LAAGSFRIRVGLAHGDALSRLRLVVAHAIDEVPGLESILSISFRQTLTVKIVQYKL